MVRFKSKNYSFSIYDEQDRDQQAWERNGEYHRRFYPATIEFGMDLFWFKNGVLTKSLFAEDNDYVE